VRPRIAEHDEGGLNRYPIDRSIDGRAGQSLGQVLRSWGFVTAEASRRQLSLIRDIIGRVGELVIGRASVLMRAKGLSISLVPLRHHPEQAGLLGGVYLAPEEVLREYRGRGYARRLCAGALRGHRLPPGLFRGDGTILRGSQNLPGNWDGFDLADYIATQLPRSVTA
jgi:hypothetical protein